jgi:UDP-N-acetylglucosamine 3-dehydrogenase
MRRLRVAVIGCGKVVQARHLPEYVARKDAVELIAVCDPNRQRARQVAERFGVPKALGDYRQVLALRPDAVSVCSPNAFHAEQSVAAFKAGAHVLCEKPMALSLVEARRMIAAAKAARRQLMIGHNQRFNAGHVRGKEILHSGKLGRCVGFHTAFSHNGPEGWSVDGPDCQFFKKRLAGMGAMADLGVHKTDLMRWLLEDEFVQATAMIGTIVKRNCNVEDSAFAVLRSAKGIIGQMLAAWTCAAGGDNSTVLYCQKGVLRLEDDPQFPVIVEYASGERVFHRTQAIQTNQAGGQYRSGVIDSFVDCVLGGRKVPVPGEEGAASLAVVLACMQAARTGRTVRVGKV